MYNLYDSELPKKGKCLTVINNDQPMVIITTGEINKIIEEDHSREFYSIGYMCKLHCRNLTVNSGNIIIYKNTILRNSSKEEKKDLYKYLKKINLKFNYKTKKIEMFPQLSWLEKLIILTLIVNPIYFYYICMIIKIKLWKNNVKNNVKNTD